jgi:hypothetical protein
VAEITYGLCAATSLVAALLLLARFRRNPTGLLFWSALAFSGLTLNNLLVVVDLLLVPHIDLAPLRALLAAGSMLVLLAGLIAETT